MSEMPKYSLSGTYHETGSFDFEWWDEYRTVEHFDHGFETMAHVRWPGYPSNSYLFRVGFTYRETAGMTRRRIIVWEGKTVLVQFTAGNNYDRDRLYASLIKIGGKQIHPYDSIPEEYMEFRVQPFNSIVRGQGAYNNMAVIVEENDLDSIVKHAIIRDVDKGKI